MRLFVVLAKHHRLLSLAAILDVFDTVNRFLKVEGKASFFEITLVGEDRASLPESVDHHPFSRLEEGLQGDLIFVPAFGNADMATILQENAALYPWLCAQYSRGAVVASVCTGAFLLGAAGLLYQRRATTHMDAMAQFAACFPEVNLQPSAVVTQDERVYTSGGATSGFLLKLALIQKYYGRDMAIRTAKVFAIDMDRDNQSYFGYFNPPESHNDQLVLKVQQAIKQRYAEIKSVDEAIADIPASRRNFLRRFKQATGLTPIRYLQRTKIEAAKQLLENSDKSLLEVMLLAGYSDMKNFRQLFKESTGMNPKAYRDKFALRFEPIIPQDVNGMMLS